MSMVTSTTTMITTNFAFYIILALVMAVTAGIVGAFAVMRRLSIASDPMSHIALPGLGLALLFGVNPLLGATASLLVGAFIIWGLENKTKISTDAMIGVVFSLALAIGALITPSEEIINALFGSYSQISLSEFAAGIAISLGIIIYLLCQKEKITLSILSPELAKTSGLNNQLLNLYFLIAMVMTIMLGLRYLGALLAGTLIIIPAVTAKNLARSLSSMFSISAVVSLISVASGLALSEKIGVEPGPVIICAAGLIFIASLLIKKPE
jgi:ABC-type Mn2+/Zn2+ transport system permease subunit